MNQETNRSDLSEQKDLKEQVKDTLKWISDHKWVVSGFLMFVSIIYWYDFISIENIPINITSSSFVASLLVVFSLISFIVVILAIFACISIMIFFIPVGEKDGEKQFIGPKTDAEFKTIDRSFLWRWLAIQSFISIALLGPFLLRMDPPGWVYLFNISAVLLFSVYILKPMFPSDLKLKSVSFEFWITAIFSMLPQLVFVTFVAASISKYLKYRGIYIDFFLFFTCSIILALVQLFIMRIIKNTQFHIFSFKRLIIGLLFIIFACSLYPPIGSFLLRTVLQQSSSGARKCAILSWEKSAAFDVISPEVIGDVLGQSKPLRIFVEMDGYYIVRTLKNIDGGYIKGKEKSTYFIPRTLVTGMDGCPAANKETASQSGQEQSTSNTHGP